MVPSQNLLEYLDSIDCTTTKSIQHINAQIAVTAIPENCVETYHNLKTLLINVADACFI